jgi:hypothetical protein
MNHGRPQQNNKHKRSPKSMLGIQKIFADKVQIFYLFSNGYGTGTVPVPTNSDKEKKVLHQHKHVLVFFQVFDQRFFMIQHEFFYILVKDNKWIQIHV